MRRHPARPGKPAFWALTRHADVIAVPRDAERFSSEHGDVLETLLNGGDSASGEMLPVTDGAAGLRSLPVRLTS